MDRAAELLRGTTQPVLQVSGACGHRSPGQFTAAFRSRFGVSPTEFGRCVLGSALVVGGALYSALSAYARQVERGRARPDDWVGYAAVNGLGMVVILHVAVWRRWPSATVTKT